MGRVTPDMASRPALFSTVALIVRGLIVSESEKPKTTRAPGNSKAEETSDAPAWLSWVMVL